MWIQTGRALLLVLMMHDWLDRPSQSSVRAIGSFAPTGIEGVGIVPRMVRAGGIQGNLADWGYEGHGISLMDAGHWLRIQVSAQITGISEIPVI